MSASFNDSKNQGLNSVQEAQSPALGFLELSSISRGLFLTDTILKKAPVKVVTSQPVSSGKHVILFFGDVAEVSESYQAAIALADGTLIKNILIAGVHTGLIPFLDSMWAGLDSKLEILGNAESVGIVESTSLAGAILSTDAALKASRVNLVRFRLGQGIGGKAYFVLSGDQQEIEAGLDAASESLKSLESFQRVDLVARPLEESLEHF